MHISHQIGQRWRAAGAAMLLAGAAGAVAAMAIVSPEAANATTTACTTGSPGTTGSCSVSGTLTLAGGNRTLEAPGKLAWSATLNGASGYVAATSGTGTSKGVTISVLDYTGTGAGWNVTAAASAFTGTTGGASSTGVTATAGKLKLAVNGTTGTGGPTASSAPPAACTSAAGLATTGTGCTGAITLSYPATVSGTAKPILEAASGSGIGKTSFSPVAFWVSYPANAYAGKYTTSVTLAISSGP